LKHIGIRTKLKAFVSRSLTVSTALQLVLSG